MRNFEPLAVQREVRVRDAWMGEEIFLIPMNHPWRILVDIEISLEPGVQRQLHRWGYFRLRREPYLYAYEWTFWPLWGPLKISYKVQYSLRTSVRILLGAGLLRLACDESEAPRWRDLRLGGKR